MIVWNPSKQLWTHLWIKNEKRRKLPSYLSSHSIHLFDGLQTECKRLKSFDLKNFCAYNKLCKDLEMSLELATTLFFDNFSSSNFDMNNCHEILSNLKSSDIPESMIDPKKQTSCGFDSLANALNEFFVSVFKCQLTFSLILQKTNKMNWVSQMKYSETLRLHLATALAQTLCLVKVYEIAPTVYTFTSIIQSPSLCNQTTNHPHGKEQSLLRCFKDGWKAETSYHRPIASLSEIYIFLFLRELSTELSSSIYRTRYLLTNSVQKI